MTFDLDLVRIFSGLGFAAGYNHIYLDHVMAVITYNKKVIAIGIIEKIHNKKAIANSNKKYTSDFILCL